MKFSIVTTGQRYLVTDSLHPPNEAPSKVNSCHGDSRLKQLTFQNDLFTIPDDSIASHLQEVAHIQR